MSGLSSDAASLPEIGGKPWLIFHPVLRKPSGKPSAAFWQDEDRRKAIWQSKGRKRARLFSAQILPRSHLEAFAAAEKVFRKTRYLRQALRYSKAGQSDCIPVRPDF